MDNAETTDLENVKAKEKVILKTETILNKETYRWAYFALHKKITVLFTIVYVLLILCGIVLFIVDGKALLVISVVLIAIGIARLLRQYIIIPKQLNAVVDTLEKKGAIRNQYIFYETYFERHNAAGNAMVKYEELCDYKENAQNFVFMADLNRILILDKTQIPEADYEFLRKLLTVGAVKAYAKKRRIKFIFGYILLVLVAVEFVLAFWGMLGSVLL